MSGLASDGPGLASKEPRGVQTNGRTDRFPLYSTGLRPLRFPPGPLSCSHNSYHNEIPEQGKGTDEHLLPLGDWFYFSLSMLITMIIRVLLCSISVRIFAYEASGLFLRYGVFWFSKRFMK